MSLKPGDAVEHFVIVAPLGEGGMGQVYVARDTRLQRSVALKIVQPDAEGGGVLGSGGAARLLREAQAAAALEHPNVVTIYEVGEVKGEGEESGRPFIAMELVKGKPLRAFVGDERVPLGERVRWLADVARALGCAHKEGLVHRDMKPENVMVRDDGVIKVLDFGIAKRAASPSMSSTTSTEAQVLPSLTAKGVAVGTPYYMAPEQMRREPLDGRADQFAWGVVAYELLSGTPPWGREVDALELVSKLLSEDPAPLASVRPDLPSQVARVVERAMAKKKTARFASMEEVVAALNDTSGAFEPTMPRIRVSAPDVEEVAPAPAPIASSAAYTTVSVRPRRRRRWLAPVALASVASASALAFVVARHKAPPAPVVAPAAIASAHECAKNSECVAKLGGKPAVCNAHGVCAAVESEDCSASFEPGDLARDDLLWVGTMYPLTGPMGDDGHDNARGVELARRDFEQVQVSLRAGATRARPIAVVSCDEAKDAKRAATHLVDDVGVPAVIGFGNGVTLAELASTVFGPRKVLAVATMTRSPFVTEAPHPRGEPPLVWRTTFSAATAARALAKLVEAEIDPAVHEAGNALTRVAVLRVKSAGAQATADRFFDALHFNGKSALENGGAYMEVVIDEAATGEDPYPSAVARLQRFAPHVIVRIGGEEFAEKVFVPLERGWPASERTRPRYLEISQLGEGDLAMVGRDRALRSRFYGVTFPATTPANGRFARHYNEAFATDLSRADVPGDAYDALYLVGYASFAVETGAASGLDLARAVERLSAPVEPIEVGPSGILKVFNKLAAGDSVRIEGAAGALSFDLATGERQADLAVLCIDVDGDGKAVGNVESGVIYRAATGELVGRRRCP